MPGAHAKWLHFQSEHFEVYSDNAEWEARRLLHNLELVHAIVFECYGIKPVRSLPVTVFFFAKDQHFEAYRPASQRKLGYLGANYHPDPVRGYITVAPPYSHDGTRLIPFDCYTSHLFRLMDQDPPAWYRAGMAVLFRNIVIGDKTFQLGADGIYAVGNPMDVPSIAVERLLNTNEKQRPRGPYWDARRYIRDSFYQVEVPVRFSSDQQNQLFGFQSWVLVHYLYFGAHRLKPEGLREFIGYALKNHRNFDAEETRRKFESTLGITYKEMNSALRRHMLAGRFTVIERPLPTVPSSQTYVVREASLAEINLRLAELGLRANGAELGRKIALGASGNPEETARFEETMGAVAARDEQWDKAAEHWERALRAGSTNPAIFHELIGLEHNRWFSSRFDPNYRLPTEVEARLRQYIEQSIAVAPQQTLAYEVLAWVEASSSHPRTSNINLVQRHFARLKGWQRTLLALTVARMRLGDRAGAGELLNTLSKASSDPWILDGVEQIRALLAGDQVESVELSSGP